MKNCDDFDKDEGAVFIRVDGEWERYSGTTSLRKLYYRAYGAKKSGWGHFYIHEYDHRVVTGAMFPVGFWKQLSCVSMDGIDTHNLPHRIVLSTKKCRWIDLGNMCGKICTYCGRSQICNQGEPF